MTFDRESHISLAIIIFYLMKKKNDFCRTRRSVDYRRTQSALDSS